MKETQRHPAVSLHLYQTTAHNPKNNNLQWEELEQRCLEFSLFLQFLVLLKGDC
jgi:hypothetical protein